MTKLTLKDFKKKYGLRQLPYSDVHEWANRRTGIYVAPNPVGLSVVISAGRRKGQSTIVKTLEAADKYLSRSK